MMMLWSMLKSPPKVQLGWEAVAMLAHFSKMSAFLRIMPSLCQIYAEPHITLSSFTALRHTVARRPLLPMGKMSHLLVPRLA